MAVSGTKILLFGVVIPAFCYLFYNDLLLFTIDGEEDTVEKAVRNAIAGSGYEDLELRRISDYHCERNRGQKDKEVRTFNCTASAVFTDGTAAEVSVLKKEYMETFYRNRRKREQAWRKDFSVIVHGLGFDVQGEASISKIIRLG